MKWSNCARTKVLLVVFVAVIVLVGGSAKADFTWTQKADMPTTRYNPSTSVVGGKIYAFGGAGASTRVDEYNPVTDTWTRKADMPTPRSGLSTCVLNDKIYLIGGGTSSARSKVEVYDPATDTWAEQTNLPSPRYTPVASVVDGIFYAIGGKGKTNDIGWEQFPANIVEAYNPATDTWTRKADMHTPRWMQSGCAVNGKIYIIGGMTSGGVTTSIEEYDPMTDTWTMKTPMPTARCLFDTCVIDGKICAIGGWRPNVTISTVEVYNPQTDTWTTGVDLPIPTEGVSTSVIGEKIYVMGGWSSPTGLGGDGVDTFAVYVSEVIVDFNGDGFIDNRDLDILNSYMDTNEPLCDIAPMPLGDGVVDDADVEVLMSYWGQDIGLVGHWKLDETEGTVVYDDISNIKAQLYGDPVWQPTDGMVDGALLLDGIDDFVGTWDIPGLSDGDFSVFVWIKGGAPGQVVVSEYQGVNWLMADSSQGYLKTDLTGTMGRSAGESLVSEITITDGQWHHVGITWDGTNRILNVDDVAVASDTLSDLERSGMGLNIGCGPNEESDTFWSGLIDDVRIYDRAITP